MCFQLLLLSILLVNVESTFPTEITEEDTSFSITDDSTTIFGANAINSHTKFFTYSITPFTETGTFISNISSDCSTVEEWDEEGLLAESAFSCTLEAGMSVCTQSGTYTTTGTEVCLIIYCTDRMGSSPDCEGNFKLSITDALVVKTSVDIIPWLWSSVKIYGSGFGNIIGEYTAICKNSQGEEIVCVVKNIIDTEAIEISISEMVFYGDSGPISISIKYGEQQTEFVQIGVIEFGGFSYYLKYFFVFGIFIGLMIYCYMKFINEEKDVKETNNAVILTPTSPYIGINGGASRYPAASGSIPVAENVSNSFY